jgi:hypothetical protein
MDRRVAVPSAPVAAALTQLAVLVLGSAGYGFHRDELYFRMLPPAWGYLDQPPLAPLLARVLAAVVDEPWSLRLPASLATAAAVLLVAAITAELGGGRRAQAFAAWGAAFAGLPLVLGHVLLTSALDLPLTLAMVLAGLRALRGEPRWWLVVGAVSGAAVWNRWLVVVPLAGLATGVLLLGPRDSLRTRWPWLGALVALGVAAPQVVYQVTNGWPQLTMGQALSAANAADTRAALPLILVAAIGILLVPVWLWGVVHVARVPEARWLLVAVGSILTLTWVSGAQPHYPVPMLLVLWAAGCVPLASWTARHGYARVVAGVLAANAVVSVVLALPVIPLDVVGRTPVPDVNPLVGDQVGWPRYVEQVARVWDDVLDPDAVVLTSNYGEAGAVDRFGPMLGLPSAYSGHNALGDLGPPPDTTETAVVVGAQYPELAPLFARCEVRALLDNGVGVDSEEQGVPVAVCRGPRRPWADLWPSVRHLD